MANDSDEVLLRAVRLYRIPGVTQREVCERLGIGKSALRRARERLDVNRYAWDRDLLISALTNAGRETSGAWPSDERLATLASYLDYVNKDGSTAQSVAAQLDALVRDGILARDGDRFELLEPFP